jgi:hypothetical protein
MDNLGWKWGHFGLKEINKIVDDISKDIMENGFIDKKIQICPQNPNVYMHLGINIH